MKHMMRGHERRRRRRIAAVCAIAALVLGGGAWLLLFSKDAPLRAAGAPAATPQATPQATQPGSPESTPSESVLGVSTQQAAPAFDRGDWRLILVSPQSSLPEGFEVALTELKNGQAVDSRCYPDLQKMMDDCRAAGLSPLICSSYRTSGKQQQLFDNKVKKLKESGLSEEEARAQAAAVVPVPGASEHQTGLAVDIVDIDNQNLDETQAGTPVQQWLSQNCWKYGFILRYPAYKTDVTGILYESWHYRYVGADAAREMVEQGLCLEEFLERLP